MNVSQEWGGEQQQSEEIFSKLRKKKPLFLTIEKTKLKNPH